MPEVVTTSRSCFSWTPVVGWVLLTCAASVAHAQSESSSPAVQTLIEQTPQVDLPSSSVLAPFGGGGGANTSNELGISLGAFTLFPVLELQTGYDSNVFATVPPATPSPFLLVKPALELKSEWLNHSLRILATGGFGFYPSASSQNFENYLLQADGKLDIQNDFYLTGLVAVRRQTEALGTPNTQFAQAPTVVDSVPVEIGLYQKFNRFFYQLTGSATRYWYYDYSQITSASLPGFSRDRFEYEEKVRLGYEILDGVSVWIQPGLNQRVYQQFVNVAGQQRDSRGFFFNLGSTVVLGPKSIIEGYIGHQNQTYIADGTSTPAFTFGLTGTWNGYEPLTIRPAIMRSINESAYSNYQNYVSTTVGVDFTYDIHDAWKAVGGTSINTAEFNPVSGSGVGPRTDYFWKASIGLLYAFKPQFELGPLYEHTSGWSTDVAAGGPSYTRELFSIRLVARR